MTIERETRLRNAVARAGRKPRRGEWMQVVAELGGVLRGLRFDADGSAVVFRRAQPGEGCVELSFEVDHNPLDIGIPILEARAWLADDAVGRAREAVVELLAAIDSGQISATA